MPDVLADPNVRLLALIDLLLVLKMVALGVYTSSLRLRRNVFATPEDYALRATAAPVGPDEDIERVRRAHRNDLENILPFFVVSFIYVLTRPAHGTAAVLLWGFLGARTLHSIYYVRGKQPHRTITFTVGAAIMLMMLLRALATVV